MRLRLLFCLLFSLLALGSLSAQPRGKVPPQFLNPTPLDEATGKAKLQRLRDSQPIGDSFLGFELAHFKKGKRTATTIGYLWSSWNDLGPISRLLVRQPDNTGDEQQFLLQSGPNPKLLGIKHAAFAPLPPEQRDSPLMPGIGFTAFDVQMPFIYWPDTIYEGPLRLRGRQAHNFLLYPPTESAAPHGIAAVRLTLDATFNAPLRIQLLGEDGAPARTLQILGFKKVGDQWLVKTIDLLDEKSREKSRFEVQSAATGIDLPFSVFSPDTLQPPFHAVDTSLLKSL